MIAVEHLVKDFGARRAVADVSFTINPGTVLGFLGPNGAGKTTTIRMMAGYLPPTSGTVTIRGGSVQAEPFRAQKLIGYMPENAPLYGDMTVSEFLNFIAELRGFSKAERAHRVENILHTCFLAAVRHQTIDTLSKGYRQRTCFAQALLHDPPVLLLDEPTEGLDPNQKQVVRDMIREMGREKIIMLCTHVLEEVEAVCTRVIIISDGKIVADSTPAELKQRSASYNALTVQLVGPREEAVSVFRKIGDVEEVVVLESTDELQTLRLIPRDKQPLASRVVDAARERNWLVVDLKTDGGHLDEVFRKITVTEDAGYEGGE